MSDTFRKYTDCLLLCLSKYQFIEEGLRFCLIRYHATIQFRVDGLFPYEVPLKSVEDAALGRLIEWYKSFTRDEDLIKRLRAIKASRDYVAHQGLNLTLHEQMNEDFLSKRLTELEEAHAKATECFELLIKHMELSDQVVNKAYEELSADRSARGQTPPPRFEDHPPGGRVE
jgi:hypothetical protein